MKGAVLSLCRFFPLSALHMYVELLRFSPAQVTSPLKTRSSLFADCAELVAGVGLFFFFGFFYFPRSKEELAAVLCRLHCHYSDRLTHSHRQRKKEGNSSSASSS